MVTDFRVSTTKALTSALQVSVLTVSLAAVYCAIVGLGGGSELLGVMFGSSFEYYGFLILPIAIQQLVDAGGVGPALFLRAAGKGRSIFAARAVIAPITLAVVTVSAVAGDLLIVAWSNVVTRVLALGLLVVLVRHGSRHPRPR
jgi:hypothetical protein